MKKFLCLSGIFLFIHLQKLSGQPSLTYWSAGLYASSQVHSGLLSNGRFAFYPSPGFGFALKNSFFNRIHVGIEAGYIHLRNTYKRSDQNLWSASISNVELLPTIEVNLKPYGKYYRKNPSTPYLKFCPSFNVFQTRLANVADFTQDFHFFPYTYFSTGWYTGVGYRFRTAKEYSYGIEIFLNNMLTNKTSGFTIGESYIADRYAGIKVYWSYMKL
ncbi:hypothetical protein [Schleiferia thermophila]|uniref:hypothetical protein n=1 Tax=Schleiferia thermophila TaxID=884107 RepID=UPI003EE92B90